MAKVLRHNRGFLSSPSTLPLWYHAPLLYSRVLGLNSYQPLFHQLALALRPPLRGTCPSERTLATSRSTARLQCCLCTMLQYSFVHHKVIALYPPAFIDAGIIWCDLPWQRCRGELCQFADVRHVHSHGWEARERRLSAIGNALVEVVCSVSMPESHGSTSSRDLATNQICTISPQQPTVIGETGRQARHHLRADGWCRLYGSLFWLPSASPDGGALGALCTSS
jgi:hypothetical protein